MPTRIFSGAIIITLAIAVAATQGGSPKARDLALVKSTSTEFKRMSSKIEARSPDAKSAVVLIPPSNQDAQPTMEARVGHRTLRLGDLSRSASVFWRPDSAAAIIWDRVYSDRYSVRLIRARPRLMEIRGFDQLIKRTVLNEFRTGELMHYWPYVEGWTKQNELLVVVCADGAPPNSPLNTPLDGFARAYLVDTNNPRIISTLHVKDAAKMTGIERCE